MKKIIAVVILLVLAVGLILFLRGNENTWICSNGDWVKHGNPSASKPTKLCVSPTPTVNPNANIILESPKAGDTLNSQFVIKGKEKVFENQLNFRVRNSKGQALIEGTMAARSSGVGKFGSFEATVSSLPKGKTTVEVFDNSPKDDSEIDKVSIQVTIK
jgi:hypothetical protein